MRFRVIVSLHGSSDSADRVALMEWVVHRLVETLRESPVPVTVELKTD